MLRREEPAAEEPDATVRRNRVAALQDNEARQVFVLRTQTVIHPRSSAWMADERKTTVRVVVSLSMFVYGRSHRANHRQLVGDFRKFGQHRTDGDAAFASWFVFERRRHDVAVVVELRSLDFDRHGLAVEFRKLRLGVEAINL